MGKRNGTTVQIQFKDPDTIYDLMNAQHPLPPDEEDITPRMERERQKFCDKFFEFGDYGRIEIDLKTMACRIVPRKEWR